MKYVPLSPEINQAVGLDEAAEMGKQNLSVELMNDLATDEEMKEAITAEVIDEQSDKEEERREEEKEIRIYMASEAEKAVQDLLNKGNTKA